MGDGGRPFLFVSKPKATKSAVSITANRAFFMGILSEYVNGYRGRHSVYGMTSPRFNTRTGSLNKGGDNGAAVEVYGVEINDAMLGKLMTNDPYMAANFRKLIRQVLKDVRKKLSQDAKNYLGSDPRKAARAVKFAVYKNLFGGNVSILQKKKGTAGAKYELIREREVEMNPHMRGGNRRPRFEDRNRLDYYYGADRGFVLRFISSGTVPRTSRFGNRGSIRNTDWFGRASSWHMETAAQEVADAINEYVKQQTNG